ncbi:MAG: hypothetical protein JW869_06185, partial [Candidatus Omnitrophica bacterium]|nr:hypothetical protein [Candidatus Omnitrophota bacterium]
MEKEKPDAQLNRSEKADSPTRGMAVHKGDFSCWFDPFGNKWLKVVAYIVIGAFLHQDVVWAAGTDYTQDLELMFKQPAAERTIDRLGALFNLKTVYAFDSNYDNIGSDSAGSSQYGIFDSAVQQMQVISQNNPQTGLFTDWGYASYAPQTLNQWNFHFIQNLDSFTLQKAGLTNPDIMNNISSLFPAGVPLEHADTFKAMEYVANHKILPLSNVPILSAGSTGSEKDNIILNIYGNIQYNSSDPNQGFVKTHKPSYGGLLGYNIQGFSVGDKDMHPVAQDSIGQTFYGAMIGNSSALIYPTDKSLSYSEKSIVADGKTLSRQGVTLFDPVTPSVLSSSGQLAFYRNKAANSSPSYALQLPKNEGFKDGAVSFEPGHGALVLNDDAFVGIGDITEDVLMDKSYVNEGLIKTIKPTDNKSASVQNLDAASLWKAYVRDYAGGSYGMSSFGKDTFKVSKWDKTSSNKVRVMDNAPLTGAYDTLYTPKGEELKGLGLDAETRNDSYYAIPRQGKEAAVTVLGTDGNLRPFDARVDVWTDHGKLTRTIEGASTNQRYGDLDYSTYSKLMTTIDSSYDFEGGTLSQTSPGMRNRKYISSSKTEWQKAPEVNGVNIPEKVAINTNGTHQVSSVVDQKGRKLSVVAPIECAKDRDVLKFEGGSVILPSLKLTSINNTLAEESQTTSEYETIASLSSSLNISQVKRPGHHIEVKSGQPQHLNRGAKMHTPYATEDNQINFMDVKTYGGGLEIIEKGGLKPLSSDTTYATKTAHSTQALIGDEFYQRVEKFDRPLEYAGSHKNGEWGEADNVWKLTDSSPRKVDVEVIGTLASGNVQQETYQLDYKPETAQLTGTKNIYASSITTGVLEKSNADSSQHQPLEADRKVTTNALLGDKGKYIYKSESKSGPLQVGTLKVDNTTLLSTRDDSPMFQNVTHEFGETFGQDKGFVSMVQLNEQGNVSGEAVAVAKTTNYGLKKTKLEPLSGNRAELNSEGFVTQNNADLVSGWNNINASGSFFKDIRGKGNVDLDNSARLNETSFWVANGGKDYLNFDVKEIEIDGKKFKEGEGLTSGVREEISDARPYLAVNSEQEAIPHILAQTQNASINAKDIIAPDAPPTNIPHGQVSSLSDTELPKIKLSEKNNVIYAKGTQHANVVVPNLNSPSTALSGDHRNTHFDVSDFRERDYMDTTVFLGNDGKVQFTKGFFKNEVEDGQIKTDHVGRVTTEKAGIFAGTKESPVERGSHLVLRAIKTGDGLEDVHFKQEIATFKKYFYEAEITSNGLDILSGQVGELEINDKNIKLRDRNLAGGIITDGNETTYLFTGQVPTFDVESNKYADTAKTDSKFKGLSQKNILRRKIDDATQKEELKVNIDGSDFKATGPQKLQFSGVNNLLTENLGSVSRDVTFNKYDLSALHKEQLVPVASDGLSTKGIFQHKSRGAVLVSDFGEVLSRGAGIYSGTPEHLVRETSQDGIMPDPDAEKIKPIPASIKNYWYKAEIGKLGEVKKFIAGETEAISFIKKDLLPEGMHSLVDLERRNPVNFLPPNSLTSERGQIIIDKDRIVPLMVKNTPLEQISRYKDKDVLFSSVVNGDMNPDDISPNELFEWWEGQGGRYEIDSAREKLDVQRVRTELGLSPDREVDDAWRRRATLFNSSGEVVGKVSFTEYTENETSVVLGKYKAEKEYISYVDCPLTDINYETQFVPRLFRQSGKLNLWQWGIVRNEDGKKERLASDDMYVWSDRLYKKAGPGGDYVATNFLNEVGFAPRKGVGIGRLSFRFFNDHFAQNRFTDALSKGDYDSEKDISYNWIDIQKSYSQARSYIDSGDAGWLVNTQANVYKWTRPVRTIVNRSSPERAVQSTGSIVLEGITDATIIGAPLIKMLGIGAQTIPIAAETSKAIKTVQALNTMQKIWHGTQMIVRPIAVYGTAYGIFDYQSMTPDQLKMYADIGSGRRHPTETSNPLVIVRDTFRGYAGKLDGTISYAFGNRNEADRVNDVINGLEWQAQTAAKEFIEQVKYTSSAGGKIPVVGTLTAVGPQLGNTLLGFAGVPHRVVYKASKYGRENIDDSNFNPVLAYTAGTSQSSLELAYGMTFGYQASILESLGYSVTSWNGNNNNWLSDKLYRGAISDLVKHGVDWTGRKFGKEDWGDNFTKLVDRDGQNYSIVQQRFNGNGERQYDTMDYFLANFLVAQPLIKSALRGKTEGSNQGPPVFTGRFAGFKKLNYELLNGWDKTNNVIMFPTRLIQQTAQVPLQIGKGLNNVTIGRDFKP